MFGGFKLPEVTLSNQDIVQTLGLGPINAALLNANQGKEPSNKPPKTPSLQQLDNAGQQGLQLGETITGQNLATTGTQIQDLIKRQMGLLGADNPITGMMQDQRNTAVAATAAGLAKAGVRGGAAEAAKLQTSRKMDRDIAAQAYQQYTNNLQQARQMAGGVASAQLQPYFQQQQAYIAANQPVYQPQQPGIVTQLFGGLI